MTISTPSIVPAPQAPKRVSTTTFLDNYTAAFERCYPGVPMTIRQGQGGFKVIIRGEWSKEDVVLDLEGIVDATKAMNQ